MAEAFALLAVLAGAAAQAVTGVGFALVCAPLLTLALGGGDGVRLTNALALVVNALMLGREWRGVLLDRVLLLAGPALPAALATAAVIRHADPAVLSLATGLLVLVTVGALAAGLRSRRLAGRCGALLAGAASGAMTVAGGVGGPAVASYAANAGWPPGRVRPTLAACFLTVNLVAVAARGVRPTTAGFGLLLGAALAAGFAAGAALSRRVRPGAVWSATLALAAGGAAAAVVRGLW